jgi:hypothetical protein
MTTFDPIQNVEHRNAYIKECRQKAWGYACHADWISKDLDLMLAQYKKLQDEGNMLDADIKELKNAIDEHTVDNRNKRKALQERRNEIGPQMQSLMGLMPYGQKTMQELLRNVELQLGLAKHAETWEWKESQPQERS